MSTSADGDEQYSASQLLQASEYARYEECGIIQPLPEGFAVVVNPSWPIEGEDRIGYTQIIRLIECAREKHWRLISDEVAEGFELPAIDSTVAEIGTRFIRPMKVGCVYIFSRDVTETDAKGYVLEVRITDKSSGRLAVSCRIMSRYLRVSDGLPINLRWGRQ